LPESIGGTPACGSAGAAGFCWLVALRLARRRIGRDAAGGLQRRERAGLRRAGFGRGGEGDDGGLRGDRGRRGVGNHRIERGRLIPRRVGLAAGIGRGGGVAVVGFRAGVGGRAVFGVLGVFRLGAAGRGLAVLRLGAVAGRFGVGAAVVVLRVVGAVGAFRALGPGLPRGRRGLGVVQQLGERGGRLPGIRLRMTAGAGRVRAGRQDRVVFGRDAGHG
jgi:hypothetical protein